MMINKSVINYNYWKTIFLLDKFNGLWIKREKIK